MLTAKEANRGFENFINYKLARAYEAKNRQVGAGFIMRNEKRMANRLKRVFNKQLEYFVEAFKQIPFSTTKSFHRKEFESQISVIITEAPGTDELVEIIIAYVGLSMSKGANDMIRVHRLAQFGVSFDLADSNAQRVLNRRRLFELSQARGSISSATNKRIVKLVQDGLANALSYTQVASQIRKLGDAGVFSKARAELIAATEVGRAYGDGQFEAMQEFNSRTGRQSQKEWLTAADGSVRDSHLQNERDGWIDQNDLFSGTFELNAPSKDFGCRCVTNYRLL